ncbi:MAG TPA: NADH-quinone oxidoreductase subunit L [Acidimicrobiales bacterium]|nr:NADH-quinone oxidoreductase subunit L [Acidimicrobiales bacterium]
MLENAFVIPLITFVSFWLILFFGKRLPKGGSEIGVLAVGATLVLSLVAGYQWIDRDKTLEVHHGPAAAHGDEAEHAEEGDSHAEEETDSHAEDEGEVVEDDHAIGGEPIQLIAAEEEGGHGEAELIREPVRKEWRWFPIAGDWVHVGTHVDGVTVLLLITVSLISFLVHVFSTNYMHDDRRYTHFFAALSLFTTGMFVLVTSTTTLGALFGWELMGLCSFMLIGHWWEEKPNSNAALKAFLTTRTGDIGLLVGISILFFAAGGTFDIATINEHAIAGEIGRTALVAAAAALLIAVIGKSAQFPLHTWLPDAMAGPTPVSALIHAATMVVAGVYLLARLYGVFWEGFNIADGGFNAVAIVGSITILIAAALAFVQNDIKKVLAYSTVSQLGYMVMALGVGAWTAAIFHLFTHAMFKALLFLGSGSVSHAVHSFDMKKEMGGLREYMPTTYKTFMIGSVALAGVFPLAGFWSKDEILLGAKENGFETFMVIGLIGAFMTAMYMTRCVYLTFFGEYRGHGHPHESPKAITVPLIVLAVLSVGVGFLNSPLTDQWLGHLIDNETVLTAGMAHHDFSMIDAVISTVVVLASIGIGYLLFFKDKLPKGVTEKNKAAKAGYTFLVNKYYLDNVYTDGVVGSLKGPIARAAYWFNQHVIDGVVNGVGVGSRRVGDWIYKWIDQGAIDGTVNGSGFGANRLGDAARRLQTGRVQQYGSLLFGAVAVLAIALVLAV